MLLCNRILHCRYCVTKHYIIVTNSKHLNSHCVTKHSLIVTSRKHLNIVIVLLDAT